MQILRRHRHPVRGASLATELGISLRTLYRDIAALQAQGACIDGEPGLGYLMRPGFLLPPLMFSEEEVEALVLGARWVANRADRQLGDAARNLIAKVAAVLPDDLRRQLEGSTLLVVPGTTLAEGTVELAEIRLAIRRERKIDIVYRDVKGDETVRMIWPFALGFFEAVRVVIAWCELRQAFRHFRTDRIISMTVSDDRYPRRRPALLKEWRLTEGIPTRP